MLIKNLSIAKKISLSFLLIALINILFGVFLNLKLNSIKAELINFADDTLPAVDAVNSIRYDLSRLRAWQIAVYTQDNPADIQQRINDNIEKRRNVEAKIAAYGKTVWPGEEQETFNRLMKEWGSYKGIVETYYAAMLKGDRNAARGTIAPSLETFGRIDIELGKLTNILRQAMDRNKHTILSSVDNMNVTAFVSNAFILLLMVVMTVVLARLICGPLKIVVAQANAIAKGDLSKKLDRSSIGNDELGELADATSKMQNDLRTVIHNVVDAVNQLSQSVEQMTHISQQSATGMKEQQLQITHIATAMTEMKATVADVAENTQASASKASHANDQTQMGVRETQSIIDSIEEVATVIGVAGDTVTELEKQSSQINVILDVIRDIADQTNLLALNAAIEAARAGESGRGFAVVADEVRTLAGRTQHSTSEITAIIEQLQSLAKKAQQASELSRNNITACAEQGLRSKQLMSDIGQAIADISDTSTQIATACTQQDSVAEDLSRSTEQIHLASQEVAEGSQKTSQACQELSRLSSSLQEAMRRFKLN